MVAPIVNRNTNNKMKNKNMPMRTLRVVIKNTLVPLNRLGVYV
jgi:hypothetical protein